MNNLVFITGAGFSRPHGLPLMSDFYEISRELFDANPNKYSHFEEVFQIIKDLHYVKSYYSSDLFNIEEILSILEMWQEAGGKELEKPFKIYIEDVIKAKTKKITYKETFPGNWQDHLFTTLHNWHLYGFFTAQFFPIQIRSKVIDDYGNSNRKFYVNPAKREQNLSLITLNYDRLLENVCQYINENFETDNKLSFTKELDESESPPFYAKLHGSIGNSNIVPPTWNKGINESIKQSWKLAHNLLQKANKIIILGYSLPKTDSYIRYLLKSSILENNNLKTIDVITLDDEEGTTKDRYKSFIKFKNFRFVNENIQEYLKQLYDKDSKLDNNNTLKFNSLEKVHKKFMNTHAS